MHTADFQSPVELGSIQQADRTLARFLPVLAMMAVGVLVLSLLILGLLIPHSPAVYYPVSVLAAVAIPAVMYRQKRRHLTAEYRQHKRLTLSAAGLRRIDGATVVDIPWHGITRIQAEAVSVAAKPKGPIVLPVAGIANAAKAVAHSAKALGILGDGTVAPAPGASERVLKMHDELNGSQLAAGKARRTPNALIFPSEFERDWVDGVIGSWLRHYRPDIQVDAFRGH
ncbi:hypothetical protein [Mycolicibacterium llatzerense]|uniref:hypothetical protein n=1 Tax=Mycolicibacterium llatzerense TaxID=280871 RepID=UPI0031DE9EAF